MQRRNLILGIGVIVALGVVYSLQFNSPQPVHPGPRPNLSQASDSATTRRPVDPPRAGTSIPVPALAEWRPHQLSIRPASRPEQVKLQEDASLSWRNIQTEITVQPSSIVELKVTFRSSQKRKFLVFIFSGDNRLRCTIDPNTGITNANAIGNATDEKCTTVAAADGWWDVTFSGVLDGTRNEVAPAVIAFAMASQNSQELYQGDGLAFLELTDVIVRQ